MSCVPIEGDVMVIFCSRKVRGQIVFISRPITCSVFNKNKIIKNKIYIYIYKFVGL